MECNIEKNKADCTCTYASCRRKGKCCDCVPYHRDSGELPGCFFNAKYERTYNRSVSNFIRMKKE